MTREEAKELLPIIQAFADGKTIQYNCENENPQWMDVQPNERVDFSQHPSRYRIKPAQKYRSFNNAEECWQEMQNHQPFGWVKDGSRMCNVINISEDGVIAHNGVDNSWYDFERSFKLTFADGTPFGIKEE